MIAPASVTPPCCPACCWQPPASAVEAHRWHRLGRHLGAEHPHDLPAFLGGIEAGRREAIAELDANLRELAGPPAARPRRRTAA